MDPLSAGLMAGANLLGGLISSQGARDANAANNATALRINQENWEHSLYMANNSIQMKKGDAEKAGIHPLYALGAPTMSFAPSTVGAPAINELAGIGEGLRSMGQDVSRASYANQSPANKVTGLVAAQGVASNSLDLETKKLNNELLRARIAQITQPGTPPGVPFTVPEKNKAEERPQLMIGGRRWDTNPNTSPMKAWEDQYGDEGPVAWSMPIAIFANDFGYNLSKLDPSIQGARAAARDNMTSWNAQYRRWFEQYMGDVGAGHYR